MGWMEFFAGNDTYEKFISYKQGCLQISTNIEINMAVRKFLRRQYANLYRY